jgi:hypothetical protein
MGTEMRKEDIERVANEIKRELESQPERPIKFALSEPMSEAEARQVIEAVRRAAEQSGKKIGAAIIRQCDCPNCQRRDQARWN